MNWKYIERFIVPLLTVAVWIIYMIGLCTRDWMVYNIAFTEANQKAQISRSTHGLFTSCHEESAVGEQLVNTTCNSVLVSVNASLPYTNFCTNTISMRNSRYRACQAFAIIGMLFLTAAMIAIIVRRVRVCQSVADTVVRGSLVLSMFSTILLISIFSETMRDWYGCGFGYCDLLKSHWYPLGGAVMCGFGYSFGCMGATLFFSFAATALSVLQRWKEVRTEVGEAQESRLLVQMNVATA